MPVSQPDTLPEHLSLALASAMMDDRRLFAAGFALDVRLGHIAMRGSEPLLGQIGLAWWRERLANLGQETVVDPLLQDLAEGWGGHRDALVDLVDGWEALGVAEGKGAAAGASFSAGREGLFRALAELTESPGATGAAASAGTAWACADLLRLGLGGTAPSPTPQRLPRRLRPLAVVAGLAHRAVRRGDGVMLGDRFSPLAALRLGIFGV